MDILNDDRKIADDYFGSWFAGFVDGEGHFGIDKDNRRNLCVNYRCIFRIALRDDDKLVLVKIRNTLGIGKIYDKSVHACNIPNSRSQTGFQVTAIKDCVKLVRLFEKCPLQSKKQRDFEVWKEAVFEVRKPLDCRNADLLEYYFHKIREVRQYEKQDELVKPVSKNVQLMIGF